MKEYRIQSFVDFHQYVQDKFIEGIFYRGVNNIKLHKLIPSVGRVKEETRQLETIGSFYSEEKNAFTIFKTECQRHSKDTLTNYWEYLFLAQHHGLRTRLMDWSYNPLVALFFAVEHSVETDSAVYVCDEINSVTFDDLKEQYQSSDDINSNIFIIPKNISPRMSVQSAIFSIQPNPFIEFHHDKLSRIVIPNNLRDDIQVSLNKFGINRKSLFPDLDGLCAWIDWHKFRNM